ncbi:MAG: hypothetical protein ACTHJ0_06560, partial [Flavipsychrobacter sp.]
MKTIQILLFLFVFTSAAFAQNTDPISYHSSHQMSDTSYSLKKANGDSTIFLFEGGGADSAYTRMSVNADSTQVIFDGNNHPPDTLEVWGMGNNADTTYSDIFQQNDSTLIFQKTSGVSDTVAFFGVSNGNAGIQADWNETDSQQADFIKNKPTLPGIVLTTTGINGNATLSGDTLNIPNYSGNGAGWNLTGNAGTTSSDFIGTTDNQPLVFKVNNKLSGYIGTSSTYNFSLGILTTPDSSTGIKNTAIGSAALGRNGTGYNNNAIGYATLYNNEDGHDNTANGWSSMGFNSSGVGNTAMGSKSMNQVGSSIHIGGSYNSAFGYGALSDNWNNKYNIGLGSLAGSSSTSSNTLYISDSTYHLQFKLDSAEGTAPSVVGKDNNGYWHVYQNSIGGAGGITQSQLDDSIASAKAFSWNLKGNAGTNASVNFIGTTDNQPLVFKVNNIIAGFVQSAGSYNQSFGYSALKNVSTGIKNFADGPFALYQNTTGYRNTAIGYTAFYSNTAGGDNTIIGALAAPYLNGFNNTVIGVSALNGPNATVYTGNNNTAIGSSALRGASMHSNNIGIGYNAGFNATLDNTLFISDSTRKMYFA